MGGVAFDCPTVLRLPASGAAARCPDNDCGVRTQAVTAIGHDGRETASSTRLVLHGQAGRCAHHP